MPAEPQPPDISDLARLAKALGDEVRLRILDRLPATDDCERVLNVSELAEALDLPQSTVSRHLGILRQVGLVRSERMCRDVYYWIDGPRLQGALHGLGRLGQEQG
jgi:ArsR family transcriptional regulator